MLHITKLLYAMCSRGVDFPDLLPAGVSGLERAINRFDASKGFKFSTYAHWWIRQAVSRCVQVLASNPPLLSNTACPLPQRVSFAA